MRINEPQNTNKTSKSIIKFIALKIHDSIYFKSYSIKELYLLKYMNSIRSAVGSLS